MLPGEQEAEKVPRGDRLDLRPQPPDRIMMDARQEAPIAPLLIVEAGKETSLENCAVALERRERSRDSAGLKSERRGKRRWRDRSETLEPAAQDLDQRVYPPTMFRRPVRRAARSPARAAPPAKPRGIA